MCAGCARERAMLVRASRRCARLSRGGLACAGGIPAAGGVHGSGVSRGLCIGGGAKESVSAVCYVLGKGGGELRKGGVAAA